MADMNAVPPQVLVAEEGRGKESPKLLREAFSSCVIWADVVIAEGRGFEKGDVVRWELFSEVGEDFSL